MAEAESPGRKSFFRSWAFWVPAVVVVVLILLWVASEIAVPRIAASYARNEILERYPDAKDVTVKVKAFPALKLAFKEYDDLEVKVDGVALQQVNFDRVVLESKDWPDGTFEATIGQDEIERFFSLKHSYVTDPQMTITGDAIDVSGKVDIGLAVVEVESRGQLEPVDGKKVFFRPQEIQVSGIRMPEYGVELVRQIMTENPVFVVRDDLPYSISGIAARDGKLVLEGEVDIERALNVQL
jgi:hypothetical protein